MTRPEPLPELDPRVTAAALTAMANFLKPSTPGRGSGCLRTAVAVGLHGGSDDAMTVFEAVRHGIQTALRRHVDLQPRRRRPTRDPALFQNQIAAGWRFQTPAVTLPLRDPTGIRWARKRRVAIRKGNRLLASWVVKDVAPDGAIQQSRQWLLAVDGSADFVLLPSAMRNHEEKTAVIDLIRQFFGEPEIMVDYVAAVRTLIIPD